MVDFHPDHARDLDTEGTMTRIAARTARAVGASELEAEVLLTASAQSLEGEMTEMTAGTAASKMTGMIVTDIMTVTATTIAMTAADAVTEVETVDALIVATRFTKSMTTSPNLALTVTDHLWFSAGRRPSREGITKHYM